MRCTYCMPKERFGKTYRYLPASQLLSFQEICRLGQIFQRLGAQKFRLTGGEPLLRKGIQRLIEQLRELEEVEIAITTNGLLLERMAKELYKAGLDRINVSLDALDPSVAGTINGLGISPNRVLDGIDAARSEGFSRIKVNAVIQRGINESAVFDLVEHFRFTDCIVRFIEFMDVGNVNAWKSSQVVSSKDLRDAIHARYPLRPLGKNYYGEVAKRYAYMDGAGEIGFVSSMTDTFCDGCTRARLSADGKLYTCLFATQGVDLRTPIRSGATNADLEDIVSECWSHRDDRYSELRKKHAAASAHKVEMFQMGG